MHHVDTGNSPGTHHVAVFLALLGLLLVPCCEVWAQAQDPFASLKARLLRDGFSREHIAQAYRTTPELLLGTVAQTLRVRESKLNYDQFLQPRAMAQARRFMRLHEKTLTQAELAYGVEKSVIVAILSVETRLGQYTGSTPTLAILSTFALMDRKHHRDSVWALLQAGDRKRWGRAAFDSKLITRAHWAYRELSALLHWTQDQPHKTGAFRGSIMGAVGWPQFLPSNLGRYAVDGDRDGEVDLFQPDDAIFSVANYLRAYGWRQAKTRSEKEDVIHCYNRSRPYVRAVLGVAALLRQTAQSMASYQDGPGSQ